MSPNHWVPFPTSASCQFLCFWFARGLAFGCSMPQRRPPCRRLRKSGIRRLTPSSVPRSASPFEDWLDLHGREYDAYISHNRQNDFDAFNESADFVDSSHKERDVVASNQGQRGPEKTKRPPSELQVPETN